MVVVHHWDADGISSAAIILREKGRMPLLTPPVGEFRFDERIKNNINSELVYFVDLNMPEEVVKLANSGLFAKAVFIDHHIQNPIVHRNIIYHNPSVSRVEYPSASFVASEVFDHTSYLTIIGAVGDLGKKIFEIENFGERVEKIMEAEGLKKGELFEAVKLIDSNYLSMDRYGVEEAAFFLSKADIDDILEREDWIRKAEKIEKEIKDAVNSAIFRGEVAFVSFNSSNAIVSKVARELVWNKKAGACIAVNKGFNGKYQLYVRLNKKNWRMKTLIEKLKSAGIKTGGKAEVLGSVFDANDELLNEALRIVREELAKMGFEVWL
ncbi:MAG: DHH family protein [Archaeoglobus sp.]|nr:MAG: DHH family protein [Archaeoglobus sp.]